MTDILDIHRRSIYCLCDIPPNIDLLGILYAIGAYYQLYDYIDQYIYHYHIDIRYSDILIHHDHSHIFLYISNIPIRYRRIHECMKCTCSCTYTPESRKRHNTHTDTYMYRKNVDNPHIHFDLVSTKKSSQLVGCKWKCTWHRPDAGW